MMRKGAKIMLPTIKHNASGDNVKVAKYLTGYAERKKASGDFDAGFVSHVCTWQRKYNLTPDGIIGPKTWAMIAEQAPVCSTSKNSASAATCALQLLLGDLTPDGLFGTNTKKAVSAYQTSKGLKVDGIVGIKTWTALITGAIPDSGNVTPKPSTDGKTINKCVHYLQWDSRWKNIKYSTHTSKQTIGNSGCGPSAMAQIMATFIDPKITPVEMCKLSVDNGYRTYSNGTAWDFFAFVFKKYGGFGKFVKTSNMATLKAALSQGALAVCSMNSNDNGFWTKGGHFITAIGFDDAGYIYANDPNKKECPRKQKEAKFKSCLKQAFIFWPMQEEKTDPFEPVDEAGAGAAIIDISKWQDNIDFEALKPEVALVVARASCGSDKDTKIDEYAKAMNRLGIPFGVYCYSYAGDEAKARDEARKIVQYASAYNPLFYVMDAEESKISNAAIGAFADELRQQGARRIGCYVAHNHYKDYGYDTVRGLWDFTWIPRYGKNDGTLDGSTKPAFECDLWQYTSTAHIAGINGRVDMNVITGTGHTLRWFLGGDD